MTNIAINGFGRIGRLFLRALSESKNAKNINVKIINDLADLESNIHLFKYDSIHGTYNKKIKKDKNSFDIGLGKIQIISETNPLKLPWKKNKINIVIECTGILTSKKDSLQHIKAGAKKVIISAPSPDAPMFVMGVNHKDLTAEETIFSNASCTTNCLAPFVKVINDNFGLAEGLMTTVHAATSGQDAVDSPSKSWRRGRSVISNIIPTTTGAAKGVAKVIPSLEGKLTGMAIRIPTADVSLVDLTFRTEKATSSAAILAKLEEASKGYLNGIMGYTTDEVVSQDFVSETRTSVIDANACLELNANFFKVISWYDNEYGYATKIVDLLAYSATL